MKEGTWVQRIPINNAATSTIVWTNMPAADTFLFGVGSPHITLVDLSGMTKARLLVAKGGTAGAVGSKLMLRYSSTYSGTVGSYTQLGVSEIEVAVDVANVFLTSGWVDFNNEAMTAGEVYIAVVGSGGDGIIDPIFGSISVEFQ